MGITPTQSRSRSRVRQEPNANLSKHKGHPRFFVDGDVLFSITVFALVPLKKCLASGGPYLLCAHTGHFLTIFHWKAFPVLFQVLSVGVAALRQMPGPSRCHLCCSCRWLPRLSVPFKTLLQFFLLRALSFMNFTRFIPTFHPTVEGSPIIQS